VESQALDHFIDVAALERFINDRVPGPIRVEKHIDSVQQFIAAEGQ
jgi:hypothetical protein